MKMSFKNITNSATISPKNLLYETQAHNHHFLQMSALQRKTWLVAKHLIVFAV